MAALRSNIRHFTAGISSVLVMLLVSTMLIALVLEATCFFLGIKGELTFVSDFMYTAYRIIIYVLVLYTIVAYYNSISVSDGKHKQLFRVCLVTVCVVTILQSTHSFYTLENPEMCLPTIVLGAYVMTCSGGWRYGLPLSICSIVMAMYVMIDTIGYDEMVILATIMVLCFTAVLVFNRNGGTKKGCLLSTVVITAFFAAYVLIEYVFYERAAMVNIIPLMLLAVGVYSVCHISVIEYSGWYRRGLINDRDLEIARKLQQSIITRTFPVADDLSVYGYLESAQNIGGDLYLFEKIGPELYLMMIGDVSDKRLPATLYMLNARGTIMALSRVENDPGKLMKELNEQLCTSNTLEQFMTCWIGVFEMSTGKLYYANAGHTSPFVSRDDGGFAEIEMRKDPPVGFFEGLEFRLQELEMGTRTSVFLYTDGITDAASEDGSMYGEDGLARKLKEMGGKDPESIVKDVCSDIESFVRKAPQSDDIAMMCVSIDRSGYTDHYTESVPTELDGINRIIEDVLRSHDADEDTVIRTEIVAEELFANICNHAYRGEVGPVGFHIIVDDEFIRLTYEDRGSRFNPAAMAELTLNDDVSKWDIGGLGIHMSSKISRSLEYKYFCGSNIVTSTISLNKEGNNQ